MAEAVFRVKHRKNESRWLPADRRALSGRVLQLGEAMLRMSPGFLLSYADMLGVPSGLCAAWGVALGAQGQPLGYALFGGLAAWGMRMIWGLSSRWELLLTLLLVLLLAHLTRNRGTWALMACAAVCALPIAAVASFAPTAAQMMQGWATVPLAALSAPVFYRALRALGGGQSMDTLEDRLAVGYFSAMLLCGGARMMLLGVNVGALLGCLAIPMLAMCLGVGAGCFSGLVAGVVLALQGLPLTLSVALAMGGFVAGVAQSIGKRWLTCLAFLLGSLTPMCLSGAAGLGCWPAAVCGAAAVAALPRGWMEAIQRFLRRFLGGHLTAGDAYAADALSAWEKTVAAMAKAVPSPESTQEPHTPAWWQTRLCAGCPEVENCGCMLSKEAFRHAEAVWEVRQGTDELWMEALENLRGLGCGRLYHLRESMNFLRVEDEEQRRVLRRACDQRDMLVTHLTAMAGAARRFAALSSGECWWDDMSARRVRKALSELAMPARLSYVRRVQGHIQAAFELDSGAGAKTLAEELCDLCARVLDVPMSVSQVEGDRVRLAESPLLRVSAGVASQSMTAALTRMADDALNFDSACGDTAWAGTLRDGRYLAALSDGMGHGTQAAMESSQTVELLRLCMDAGYSRQQTLTAVNGMMLMAGRGERFSTVDLLTIDLWSGQAALDKLGAAGSWLMQGDMLRQLTGDTLPLGILENVESGESALRLCAGDQLVLISDGVEEAFGGREALEGAVRAALLEQTPQAAADALLEAAAEAGGQVRRDDQTALVLRVE